MDYGILGSILGSPYFGKLPTILRIPSCKFRGSIAHMNDPKPKNP